MSRMIDFFCTLIHTETTFNPFSKTAQWSLIYELANFQWRIPSIWCELVKHARVHLDHPSIGVRECIAK